MPYATGSATGVKALFDAFITWATTASPAGAGWTLHDNAIPITNPIDKVLYSAGIGGKQNHYVRVTIDSKFLDFNVVGGVFAANDVITGSLSGATAVVLANAAGVLTIYEVAGLFRRGETITGAPSGATGTTTSRTRFNLVADPRAPENAQDWIISRGYNFWNAATHVGAGEHGQWGPINLTTAGGVTAATAFTLQASKPRQLSGGQHVYDPRVIGSSAYGAGFDGRRMWGYPGATSAAGVTTVESRANRIDNTDTLRFLDVPTAKVDDATLLTGYPASTGPRSSLSSGILVWDKAADNMLIYGFKSILTAADQWKRWNYDANALDGALASTLFRNSTTGAVAATNNYRLCWDGGDFIYGCASNSAEFCRYQISTNTWVTLNTLSQSLFVETASITNQITAVAGAALVDGETFTLYDRVNPPTVFEFDSGGGVAPGNVAVAFTGAATVATVVANMVAAINGVGAGLVVTATDASPLVNLINDSPNQARGVTIDDTVVNVGFQHRGNPVPGFADNFTAPLAGYHDGVYVPKGTIPGLTEDVIYFLIDSPVIGLQPPSAASTPPFTPPPHSTYTTRSLRRYNVTSNNWGSANNQGDHLALPATASVGTSGQAHLWWDGKRYLYYVPSNSGVGEFIAYRIDFSLFVGGDTSQSWVSFQHVPAIVGGESATRHIAPYVGKIKSRVGTLNEYHFVGDADSVKVVTKVGANYAWAYVGLTDSKGKQQIMTTGALASAGSSVSVLVDSSAGYAVGDSVLALNLATGAVAPTVIQSIPDGTHVVVQLLGALPSGSRIFVDAVNCLLADDSWFGTYGYDMGGYDAEFIASGVRLTPQSEPAFTARAGPGSSDQHVDMIPYSAFMNMPGPTTRQRGNRASLRGVFAVHRGASPSPQPLDLVVNPADSKQYLLFSVNRTRYTQDDRLVAIGPIN